MKSQIENIKCPKDQSQYEEACAGFQDYWTYSTDDAFRKVLEVFKGFDHANKNCGWTRDYIKENLSCYVSDYLQGRLNIILHGGDPDDHIDNDKMFELYHVTNKIIELVNFIFHADMFGRPGHSFDENRPMKRIGAEFEVGTLEYKLETIFHEAKFADHYGHILDELSTFIAFTIKPQLAANLSRKEIADIAWVVKFHSEIIGDLYGLLPSIEEYLHSKETTKTLKSTKIAEPVAA